MNEEGERFDVEAQETLDLGNDAESRAEFHWRLAMPLFCLIGGLLALGVARVKPRQGRFTRVVPGMLIMLIYYLALLINRNAIEEGQLPGLIGLWPVHVLFAVAAAYNLKRAAQPVST